MDQSSPDGYPSTGRISAVTMLEALQSRAVEHPDQAAIVAPGRSVLTYGELVECVTYISLALSAAGVGHEDRVALVLPNGPEAATAFLGVAAHTACAPLNPGFREAEFAFYLDDLRPGAVIVMAGSGSAVAGLAGERGIAVMEMTIPPGASAGVFELDGPGRPEGKILQPASRAQKALILHTSGTTSRPKMVALTQENILSSARNVVRSLNLGPSDRCLNIMPLFHVHGIVAGILAPLMSGGSVVCTPGLKPERIADWLDDEAPTWYTAVPTMHQTIVDTLRSEPAHPPQHNLRFVRSSSAALAPSLMDSLERVFGCPVVEAYGMTEAAHQIASNPLPPAARKPRSVGVAAGPEIGILSEGGVQKAPGVVGEIVIHGPNVTEGYVGNPVANAESFEGGWFRTGDQGCLDSDGYLFITGRLKEMINRGGENIAPREIDEALLAHPDVRQAVAFAVPHPSLGEDLAVAVVLVEGSSVSAEDIRDFAFQSLADYKVPTRVIAVDAIPKGATGKVQRIGLAERLAPYLESEYQPPGCETEETVAEIFCEVLQCDRIGIHDNFFALGGDSLRATRVVSRITTALQVSLPIVSVFRKPTVHLLAAEIERTAPDVDADLLAELLDEMEGLSDEEAQALLDAELGRA